MKEILFSYIWRYMVANGFILLGKSDPPPAPDYTAAANATATGNLEAAKVAAAANRVNQVTPNGSLTYTTNPNQGGFNQSGYDAALANYQKQLATYNSPQTNQTSPANFFSAGFLGNRLGGSTNANRGAAPIAPDRNAYNTNNAYDTYTATQTLSPDEQAKLTKNNTLSNGLLDTAQLGLTGVNDKLKQGFDFNALPAQQVNAGQTAQDAIMSRLAPQFGRDEESLRTRLVNQGLTAGSQAWNNEFTNFNQGKNDAYSSAALNGIGVGQQARQQALQEQEFGRTEGLNMVNALRTGNQVQSPNFVNTQQQATTAGPDLLGATNAQYQNQLSGYNAQQAQGAGLFGGLASVAGTAASAYFL